MSVAWNTKDWARAIAALSNRLSAVRHGYLDAWKKQVGKDNVGDVFSWIFGYYRMILRGEVEGSTTPLRLSVI